MPRIGFQEFHLAVKVQRPQPILFRHTFTGLVNETEALWGSLDNTIKFPLFGAVGPNGVAPGPIVITSTDAQDNNSLITLKGLVADGTFGAETGVVVGTGESSLTFRAPIGEMSLEGPSGTAAGAFGTIEAKIGSTSVGFIMPGQTQSSISCREPTLGERWVIKGFSGDLVEAAGSGNKEAFVTLNLMTAFAGERINERAAINLSPSGIALDVNFFVDHGSYFFVQGQTDTVGAIVRGSILVSVTTQPP